MTIERVLLGAHKRNSIFFRTAQNAIDSSFKIFSGCHLFVISDAFAIKFRLLGASSKFCPEKNISNAIPTQFIFQNFAIKLRMIPRTGKRSDVGDGIDACSSQASKKMLIIESRVSDG